MKLLAASLLLSLVACSDKVEPSAEVKALLKGCDACNKEKAEMQWLETLVQKAQTESLSMGTIYLVEQNDEVIFIHQPLVVSCVACQLYDCNGNRVEMSAISDLQQLVSQMHDRNIIYESPN